MVRRKEWGSDSWLFRQSARGLSGRRGGGDLFVAIVLIERVAISAAVQEGEGMIGQGDVGLKIRHEDDSHHAATSGTA